MSVTAVIEEALAGQSSQDIRPGGYVHLLNSDVHSIQASTGATIYGLSERTPYSFERWIRVRSTLTGTSKVQSFRFWSDNLVVPPGWSVKWGTAATFVNPTNSPSSIAVFDVPMSQPSRGGNCGGSSPAQGPGTAYSQWVVLQAHVSDFSLLTPGSLLGNTGTEVGDPILIHYHFGWIES